MEMVVQALTDYREQAVSENRQPARVETEKRYRLDRKRK